MLAIKAWADTLPIAEDLFVGGRVAIFVGDYLILMKVVGEKISLTAHIVEYDGVFREAVEFFLQAQDGIVWLASRQQGNGDKHVSQDRPATPQ